MTVGERFTEPAVGVRGATKLTLPRRKPRDSGFIAPCRRGQVPLGLTEAPPALTCGVSHRARLASETVVERFTRRTALRNRQRSVGKEEPMVWYLPILPKGHPRPPPDHCASYRTQSDSFHPTAKAGGAGEIFHSEVLYDAEQHGADTWSGALPSRDHGGVRIARHGLRVHPVAEGINRGVTFTGNAPRPRRRGLWHRRDRGWRKRPRRRRPR